MSKPKKKAKGTTSKKSETKLDSFEAMEKFFGVVHQKFRVVNMHKKFPLDKDGNLKPLTPKEVVEHCRGILRCGQMMHMDFKANPNKVSYRNSKKSSSGS